ncbi:MAG TPA: formyltransferase family protein [Candidatus Methylomirabilis sp.]|nr:formyltransferase family protein [Candidatus Methylomirabilis sp.]
MFRIGWLSTGRDEAAEFLLLEVWRAIGSGRLRAEIPFVFCNRDRGESPATDAFLRLVARLGIPVCTRSWKAFKTRYAEGAGKITDREGLRIAYDREVAAALGAADVYALVGYMLILGLEMCERFPFINLHPAPPGGPPGAWEDVVWHLIEARASESGIMIHRATPELDRGPVLTYCRYSIRGGVFDPLWTEWENAVRAGKSDRGNPPRLFHRIREAGVRREAPLLVETLRALADGRVRLAGAGVYRGGERLDMGLCLTDEVEAQMKSGGGSCD